MGTGEKKKQMSLDPKSGPGRQKRVPPKRGSHAKVRLPPSAKTSTSCMKAYQLKKGDLGYFSLVFTNPN